MQALPVTLQIKVALRSIDAHILYFPVKQFNIAVVGKAQCLHKLPSLTSDLWYGSPHAAMTISLVMPVSTLRKAISFPYFSPYRFSSWPIRAVLTNSYTSSPPIGNASTRTPSAPSISRNAPSLFIFRPMSTQRYSAPSAGDFEQTGNVAIFARKRDLDVKTDREGGAGKDEKRGGQAIPAQGGLLRRVDAARFPVSGREGWRRRRKERASRDRRREPLQRRRTGRSVLSADQEKDRGDPPEDSAERMYPADGIHSAPLLFFNSQ